MDEIFPKAYGNMIFPKDINEFFPKAYGNVSKRKHLSKATIFVPGMLFK